MSWTKVAKPTSTTWNTVAKPVHPFVLTGGEPIGLLLALTYSYVAEGDAWTKVTKPASTTWTKIAKPI